MTYNSLMTTETYNYWTLIYHHRVCIASDHSICSCNCNSLLRFTLWQRLTCVRESLWRRSGSVWWYLWSSGLSPPPGEPGLQLWRRLYSDPPWTGCDPAPEHWSDQGVLIWAGQSNICMTSSYCECIAPKMSLTMSSEACLPSMKVRGIALGVRISYLKDKCENRSVSER